MIRVLIADDQTMIRNGIKFIIEQDKEIEVVGCASNGREACELCEKLRPDVVLMDIVMPVCDGIEGTRLIKEKCGGTKVLILTTFNEDENVSRALKNGADGFMLKDIETEELLLTLKSIAKGLRVIHEDAFDAVVKQLDSGKKHPEHRSVIPEGHLSEREKTIIQLIVFGKNNREIAGELFLSEGSVRNMISAVLSKLNLKDRTQLAVFAVKNNIV